MKPRNSGFRYLGKLMVGKLKIGILGNAFLLMLLAGCATYNTGAGRYQQAFAVCDNDVGICYRDCEAYEGTEDYGSCQASCEREASACFDRATENHQAYLASISVSQYSFAPYYGQYCSWTYQSGFVSRYGFGRGGHVGAVNNTYYGNQAYNYFGGGQYRGRPRFDGRRREGRGRDRRGDRRRGDGDRRDEDRGDNPRRDRPRGDGPRRDRPRGDGPRRDNPRRDNPRGGSPSGEKSDRTPLIDRPNRGRPRTVEPGNNRRAAPPSRQKRASPSRRTRPRSGNPANARPNPGSRPTSRPPSRPASKPKSRPTSKPAPKPRSQPKARPTRPSRPARPSSGRKRPVISRDDA